MMKRMATHGRNTLCIAVLTVLLLVLDATAASAHSGHSHADEGVDSVTLMQAGGILLALAVAYLAASRWYQTRDTGSPQHASREDDPQT